MIVGDGECLVTRADHGRVSLLVLNRPEQGNALSNELMAALEAHLHAIELDHGIRAVILTGAGEHFSVGADIVRLHPSIERGAVEAMVHYVQPGQRLTRRMEFLPKPLIAAVNGPAFGAGCDLVEASHLALASEEAVFCRHEIDLGLIPAFGGTQRLPRAIGRKAALELLLTGRPFEAREAQRLGLVNRVVPASMLRHSAIALADALSAKPAAATAAILRAVSRGSACSIEDGMAIEEAAFGGVACRAEAREGVAAFGRKQVRSTPPA